MDWKCVQCSANIPYRIRTPLILAIDCKLKNRIANGGIFFRYWIFTSVLNDLQQKENKTNIHLVIWRKNNQILFLLDVHSVFLPSDLQIWFREFKCDLTTGQFLVNWREGVNLKVNKIQRNRISIFPVHFPRTKPNNIDNDSVHHVQYRELAWLELYPPRISDVSVKNRNNSKVKNGKLIYARYLDTHWSG